MLTKPQAAARSHQSSRSAAWRTRWTARARGGRGRRWQAVTAAVIILPYALVGAHCRTCGWRSDRSTPAATSSRDTPRTSGGSSTTCCEPGIKFRSSARDRGRLSRTCAAHHGDQHVPASVGFPNPRPLGDSACLWRPPGGACGDCGTRSDLALHCARRRLHRPRLLRAVGRRARTPHDAGRSAAGARGRRCGHRVRPLFWTVSTDRGPAT